MAEHPADATAQAEEYFASIGARALETNRQRVDLLLQLVSSATSGQLSEAERKQAADVAHSVVGSAGTFGHRRVSELAREVELFLHSGGDEDPARHRAALGWLAEMERGLLSRPDEADEAN